MSVALKRHSEIRPVTSVAVMLEARPLGLLALGVAVVLEYVELVPVLEVGLVAELLPVGVVLEAVGLMLELEPVLP